MLRHNQRIKATKIDEKHFAIEHPDKSKGRLLFEAPFGFEIIKDGYATISEKETRIHFALDADMMRATMQEPPPKSEGTVLYVPAKKDLS